MTTFTALGEIERQLAGREKLVFTEPRFDDLFDYPLEMHPARSSLRLSFHRGEMDTVSLRYRSPEDNRLHDVVVSDAVRRHPRMLEEIYASPVRIEQLRPLLHYVHKGVPVGLHAWEAVLRRDTAICKSLNPEQIYSEVVGEIDFQSFLVDVVFEISDSLLPKFFFSGHDCYASATLKNAFLKKSTPTLTLYKYMFNPIYHGPDLGYRERGDILFARRFTTMIEHAERPVWKSLAEKAKVKLHNITRDYLQLNYMRAERIPSRQAEYNYKKSTGLEELVSLDPNGHFLGERGDPQISAGEPIFILALHSFADEATMYGLDSFLHMFDYFSSVAKGISQCSPRARIAVRFHPNTLGENLHEVEQKDCDLQRALFQKIRVEHQNVMVSCCSARLGELKSKHRIAVATRWGTIGLECMHLGIPLLCTPLAPYASLLDSTHVVANRLDLIKVLSKQSENVEKSEVVYPKDDMYRLAAALLFKQNGEAREPSFVFSKEGASYLAARGRSDERVRKALGDGFADIINRVDAKQITCDHLKKYLKRNAETEEDAELLERLLGW